MPKGSTKTILSKLNLDINFVDKLILQVCGNVQSGFIDLKSTRIKKGDLFYLLLNAKAALKSTTLIPGETTYFVLKTLAKDFELDFAKLYKEYYAQIGLEDGIFVPNTYKLPIGVDEKTLINILKRQSIARHKYLMKELNITDPNEWIKTISLASVVQKESASKQEMPLVSSVVHNRLQKRMRLQMDGSLNYGRFSHTKITPDRIKTDKTSYNTYKNYGIPPVPICIVSKDAIKAAISPEKSDYLYFVRTAKGEHSFSTTFKAHRQNFDKFK